VWSKSRCLISSRVAGKPAGVAWDGTQRGEPFMDALTQKDEIMQPSRQIAPSPYRFAERMSYIEVSAIREILKVTERPDIISFAGGMPAPELFPVDAMARAQAQVYAGNGQAAMQYSTTEGWLPLRQWIAARLRKFGIDSSPDSVLITSGSQQGIDLVAKVFLDKGDWVAVENPSYLAALQTFGAYQAKVAAVDSDEFGIRIDALEKVLAQRRPKLIYLTPEFQNPTGITLSRERRDELIKVSRRYGAPILEDNPYGELRYSGQAITPLASRDKDGLVIYISTFSKTISPGVRIGWVNAAPEIMKALVTAKQSSDLHTSTVMQHAVARMLMDFDYDGQVRHISSVYGARCNAMLEALQSHFPAVAKWTKPEGGMFVWVELPPSVRAEQLLDRALDQGVAFVPGAPFFAEAPRHNFMRLNFSNCSPEVISEGIKRLGNCLSSIM